MAGIIQLSCSCQPRRTRANNSHFLATSCVWFFCSYKSLFESELNSMFFYFFNANRRLVDTDYRGGLTGSRADATSKLREVIGRSKYIIRFLPIFLVRSLRSLSAPLPYRPPIVAKPYSPGRALCILLVRYLVTGFIYGVLV